MSDTQERAERLHSDSLVIDTCGPAGSTLYTPDMLERVDELTSSGATTGIVIQEIEEMLRATVARDELPGFWEGVAESGVDISCVTIGAFGAQAFSFEGAIRDIAGFTNLFDSSERVRKVTSASDARSAKENGEFGIVLAFQNGTHIRSDLDNVDLFHDLGVRVIQLTYNKRNLLADGCMERNASGLSDFGISAIRRMNEVGILVDTSHCSNQTTLDAIEASDRPTAVTHSFADSVNPHDRAKKDEVIRAVGESGGYFGVLLVPFFLTTEAEGTLDHFIAHFDRVVELAGAERVGIGSDWGQVFPKSLLDLLHEEMARFGFRPEHRVDFGAQLKGFETWERWPNVTAALVEAGYSDDEITGFLGENFLKVFEAACG